MKTVIGIYLALALATSAHAESRCSDISVPKDAVAAHGGRWIELTRDQWQFLRGVYVLNPSTPPGLPYGDRAVLATMGGHDGGVVFFIDGAQACTPMLAPAELVVMIGDVGAGAVHHDGAPM